MVVKIASRLANARNGLLADRFNDFLKDYRAPVDKDIKQLGALEDMSQILYEYYNKRIIVLIDEYDTPMHSAIQHDYAERVCFILLLYINEVPYFMTGK